MNPLNKREKRLLAAGIVIGAVLACLVLTAVLTLGRDRAADLTAEGKPSADLSVPSTGISVPEREGEIADGFPDSSGAPSDSAGEPEVPNEPSQLPEDTADPSQDSDDLVEPGGAVTSSDTWDKSAVYHGGDTVVYHGKIYRAKWWTQGEMPGSADVWEDTLIAAPAPEPPPAADKPSSVTPSPTPSRTPVLSNGTKVVAYYPSWRSDQSKLRYDIVTHVVYAFAIPTAEGGLRPLEGADQVPGLLRAAHGAGAKVLLGVGGWSYHDVPLESTFCAATETPERTAAFAAAIVKMCEDYGFDGVDMDWEHPRVDGSSAKQYEMLMLDLAEQLHSRGKLLTSAVLSGATADGNTYYDAAAHSDKVLAAVDWLNVMAYDGGDGERHSSCEFAVNSAKYWRDTRRVPAEKVVLGVPFYARPSWAAYGDILSAVPAAKDGDHVNYNGMEVWYNGPATIRKKAAYAGRELGGIMIWEITQDSSDRQASLLTAIGEGLSE